MKPITIAIPVMPTTPTSIELVPVEGNDEIASFYLGKYAVTQTQWKHVMGNNPSYFKEPDRPVEQVSYDDVEEFIITLNKKIGKEFRLPTEIEWEYAAKGGKHPEDTEYAGSSSVEEIAWYAGNSEKQTHDVGLLLPNKLGLYDMAGNVWEWASSYYDKALDDRRVVRGGSWVNGPRILRSANRFRYYTDLTFSYLGFRIALSVS